jgi:adenosylcobinamide-phosphate synthase
MFVTLAFLALCVEALFGYPDRLLARIGHPVMWIGALIAFLDRRLNRPQWSGLRRRRAGMAALIITVVAAAVPAAVLHALLSAFGAGIVIAALLAASLIAQRSLDAHVAAVAAAIGSGGTDAGRIAVSRIVGRDTAGMDESDICRAAIESLAENFSDGIVAPALWLSLGGLPGIAAYKAINTGDSMIGHLSERHRDFGRATARADDWVNLPASRLSALLVIAAAALVPGASATGAWRVVRRDAGRHRSPNAGWPEAAFAGALGIALSGPRRYGGVPVDDAFIGAEGRIRLDRFDIARALLLFRAADAFLVVLAGLAAMALLALG